MAEATTTVVFAQLDPGSQGVLYRVTKTLRIDTAYKIESSGTETPAFLDRGFERRRSDRGLFSSLQEASLRKEETPGDPDFPADRRKFYDKFFTIDSEPDARVGHLNLSDWYKEYWTKTARVDLVASYSTFLTGLFFSDPACVPLGAHYCFSSNEQGHTSSIDVSNAINGLESDPLGTFGEVGEDWFRGQRNARRIELLVKRTRLTLTSGEKAELAELQKQTARRMTASAPRDTYHLDMLEAALGIPGSSVKRG